MTYEATANEDIVKKVDSQDIDLSALVQEYVTLKDEYQSRPQTKSTPDQETLDFYNDFVNTELGDLFSRISALFSKIKPIYEAGLLPSKYEDEYLQLESFVNGN